MVKRYGVSIDPKVWEDARKLIAEELNMSMSKFVEMQLRAVVRSHTSPVAQVMQGIMQDFMNGDKSLSEGERRKMQSIFDNGKKVKAVKKKK
jgi:antitoxin component of RelBE/YafQ-DinJ toxin-antitoxin module